MSSEDDKILLEPIEDDKNDQDDTEAGHIHRIEDDTVKTRTVRASQKSKRKKLAEDSGSNTSSEKGHVRYVPRQKYTKGNFLAEAVIVAGLPYFAVASSTSLSSVSTSGAEAPIILQESIPLDGTIEFKPPVWTSYMNRPYTFKSREEFEQLVQRATSETLDSLYSKVKSEWKKFIDADDFHLSLCAADTIFTYFQDKIGITHYLFFVGNNNSGKSNNLRVLHFLGYRNVTSTDVTAANIYQVLGSEEEGQATICEDEADSLEENVDKMRIYKNGYTVGFPVLRTDPNSIYGRTQYRLNTFCFKAFAAEALPDSAKSKGFNQRIIEIPCVYGFPEYDIAEVASPAGEELYQSLLEELNRLRNILLLYRILHMGYLIILRGPPGSGKTTISECLKKILGCEKTCLLNLDETATFESNLKLALKTDYEHTIGEINHGKSHT